MPSVMNFSSEGNSTALDSTSRKRNYLELTHNTRTSNDLKLVREWGSGSPRLLPTTRHQLTEDLRKDHFGITQFYGQNEYEDISYRKRLDDFNYPKSRPELLDISEQLICSIHEDEKLNHNHHNAQNEEKGWSRAAIDVVNVVAGKAWEFCKYSATVFSGFRAGGGTKYPINCSHESNFSFEASEDRISQGTLKHIYPQYAEQQARIHSPDHQNSIPFDSNHMTSECISPRPAKRCQASRNKNDSLDKNWVVLPPVKSKPMNTDEFNMMATSLPRRSSSHARKNYHNTATRVSFGSPSSMRQSNSRSYIPRVSHAGLSAPSSAQLASIVPTPSSRASIPCPTTPQGSLSRKYTGGLTRATPTSLEIRQQAENWASLMKNDEKIQEDSIKRLEAQLKTMIREGKEALVSKIEVLMEVDDEDLTTLSLSPGTRKN